MAFKEDIKVVITPFNVIPMYPRHAYHIHKPKRYVKGLVIAPQKVKVATADSGCT